MFGFPESFEDLHSPSRYTMYPRESIAYYAVPRLTTLTALGHVLLPSSSLLCLLFYPPFTICRLFAACKKVALDIVREACSLCARNTSNKTVDNKKTNGRGFTRWRSNCKTGLLELCVRQVRSRGISPKLDSSGNGPGAEL